MRVITAYPKILVQVKFLVDCHDSKPILFRKGRRNPYLHIRDFEQTCDCLRIEGISDKTLRWKLFHFSLRGEARQWYNQKVSQQRGEWGVLRGNFCLDFYSLNRIGELRLEVLSFKQKDNETFGKS